MPTWRGTREDLKRALRSLPGVLAGTSPDPWGVHDYFWYEVGAFALGIIHTDFQAKLAGGRGPFDRIKWAKLAVATLARRQRAGRADDDILWETGELLASLAPPELSDSPDRVLRVETGSVVVGSANEKADRHQYGTEHMPARPVVPTGAPPRAWEKALEDAAREVVKKVIEKICDASKG